MKFNMNGCEVSHNGKSIMLSKMHITIFTELQSKSPNLVTGKTLIELTGAERRHTLTQQMSTLRKKLQVFGEVKIITHPKFGYAMQVKE